MSSREELLAKMRQDMQEHKERLESVRAQRKPTQTVLPSVSPLSASLNTTFTLGADRLRAVKDGSVSKSTGSDIVMNSGTNSSDSPSPSPSPTSRSGSDIAKRGSFIGDSRVRSASNLSANSLTEIQTTTTPPPETSSPAPEPTPESIPVQKPQPAQPTEEIKISSQVVTPNKSNDEDSDEDDVFANAISSKPMDSINSNSRIVIEDKPQAIAPVETKPTEQITSISLNSPTSTITKASPTVRVNLLAAQQAKLAAMRESSAKAPSTATAASPKSTFVTKSPDTDGRAPPPNIKMRSLQDVQQAIKVADRRNKQIETTNFIEGKKRDQIRRERQGTVTQNSKRNAKSKQINAEDIDSILSGKTEPQKGGTKRMDNKLSDFVSMLQTLEAEFSKADEQRIKKDEELSLARSQLAKYEEHMTFLFESFEAICSQFDTVNSQTDEVTNGLSAKVKQDSPLHKDYNELVDNIRKTRHQTLVTTAKHKKFCTENILSFGAAPMPGVRTRRGTTISQPRGAPAPVLPVIVKGKAGIPPPPPPPPTMLSVPTPAPVVSVSSNPVTELLSAIRGGAALKKVDQNQPKRSFPSSARKSMMIINSLQETLKNALDNRKRDMMEYDEDEDSDDAEWDDDDYE